MKRSRVRRYIRVLVGLFVLISSWPATVAIAVPRSWVGGSGSWSAPGLWSPAGVPGAGDDALIAPTDGVARTVTYDYAGSALTLPALLLDLNVGASGTTTLAMPGNNLSVTDQHVGYNGSGTFTQTGGSADIGNTIRVGTNFGSLGEVTVSGASTSLEAAWMILGNHGEGGLTIGGGGLVSVQNKTSIGDQLNGVGTAVVTGVGSELNFIGWMDVGNLGQATLTIDNQGLASGGSVYVGGGPSGFGQVYVSGAGSRLDAGSMAVGSAGQGELFVAAGGAATSDTGIVIGAIDGSIGDATISGAGTIMEANWGIVVANQGQATLSVSDGASVTAANGFDIGYGATGDGAVTVRGANSSISGAWYLIIGTSGRGTLTVDGGGAASTPTDITLANNADSEGTINIADGGAVSAGFSIYVGGSWQAAGGKGVVNVNSGGTLSTALSLHVWDVAGNAVNLSGGTIKAAGLNVNGNPSRFNWIGGTFHLTSNITFDSLAAPNTTSAAFGSARTISGSQKLKITGVESLGGVGSFALTVTNGGVHEVSDTIYIASSGALHLHSGGTVSASQILHNSGGTFSFTGGTLHVDAFVGNLNNAGGTLAPGNSPGKTTVFGNYTQSAGTLQIEIGSTAFDKFIVNGNVVFGGTLQLLLLDGYSPTAGASFNIMDWTGTSSGTFALSLPTLAGSLAWNTSQLYSSGVLSVADIGFSGDSNEDGFVDAADYVAWRKLDSANDPAYGVWRENFGEPVSGGSQELSPTPEPSSLLLMFLGLHLTLLVGRTVRRKNHK